MNSVLGEVVSFLTRPFQMSLSPSLLPLARVSGRTVFGEEEILLEGVPHQNYLPSGTIYFVPINGAKGPEEVLRACLQHDLVPAHPTNLIEANRQDPVFADTRPNFTIWKMSDGKYGFIKFFRNADTRGVDVGVSGGNFVGTIYCACIDPKDLEKAAAA